MLEFENAGADLVLSKPIDILKLNSLLSYAKKYGVQSPIQRDRIMAKMMPHDHNKNI